MSATPSKDAILLGRAAAQSHSQSGPAVGAEPVQRALTEAMRCIQCGFCLPVCPTHNVFGAEKHSPRGRIRLVKTWMEGELAADAGLLEALDLCLDCRACETACPIDVRYSVILTGARDALAEGVLAGGPTAPADAAASPRDAAASDGDASARRASLRERLQAATRRAALRHVAAKPKRLRVLARLGNRMLRGPVGRWVKKRAARRPDGWLASALVFAEALPNPVVAERSAAPVTVAPPAPAGPSTAKSDQASTDASPPKPGTDRLHRRVMLFLGCAQEGMFPETNRATAALLEAAGYRVEIPSGQACCGALARHQGDKRLARELVIRNLEAFGAYDETIDVPVVMNAGGCMAWLKEAEELFAPSGRDFEAARRLAARVRDVSQLLLEVSTQPSPADDANAAESASVYPKLSSGAASGAPAAEGTDGAAPLRVMYQPSCHLANVCGVIDEPLELLRRITGGNARLTPDGGSCCGSAGIYNLLHPQASRAILDKKMQAIAADPPDVIVTSNPGCQLQMSAGVRAAGLEGKVRVMQLAEFVREYGARLGRDGAKDGDATKRS